MPHGNRSRRNRHKQWLLKRNWRAFRKRRSRRAQPLTYKRWVPLDGFTKKSVVKAAADRSIELKLPERLDFDESYERTASHFRLLREAGDGKFRIRNLHFDKIRHISPAAALVLASEVDQWNQRIGGRIKARTKSWDKEIKRLLFEMGYFSLLGLPAPPMRERASDLSFLDFIRGDSSNRDSGKLARQLRVEIEALVGGQIEKLALFEGLSEAITNVSHHAYSVGTYPNNKKQWWLSASFNRRDRELTVIFYDQGDGIPATLPINWHSFELVRAIFHTLTDSKKIRAAMTLGRSSAPGQERGKGLQNLLSFFRAHKEGHFSIYSLTGLYRLTSMSDGSTIETVRDYETSVGGTLIEWSVKL